MKPQINRIVVFKLSGKLAHFRKFYTNASSLSYLIPPRTAVMGIIASILQIPRDQYYHLFDEGRMEIAVSLKPGSVIRKQTQCLNYLHNKYYNLLAKGKGVVMHSQCRLELLMAPEKGMIEYLIYVGGQSDDPLFRQLESKLKSGDFGYGIYFGQRQFRASAEYISSYNEATIEYCPEAEYLDSACNEANFRDCDLTQSINIINEQMPCHFKMVGGQASLSREPITVKKIYFERTGKRIHGQFTQCYLLDDRMISFY
ncbi:MAG: CRISPR-associated protein Cas5 [Anaerolineales bacterium]|nr:CRISPR-associated protein Cas5 [Anaerolineales bacterium]